ncbi:MAG: type I-E CRISPR-associated protein Cas6/Cse3/CasE [Chloroflexi bacterium]|nr:type I-E CRISPR-associated protein Cas6/Cse3/CasE [Chloroflexota bacterium]
MTAASDFPVETGVLQMVRADVNMHEFQRWMGAKRLQDPDHAMHCLLRECFGQLAPKPFRLIVPRGNSSGVFYGYARACAEELRETATVCADPLQCRVIPAEKLDSKLMPTEWQAGKLLGFETRIRPIVRLSRNNPSRPTRECDAFQAEAEQHPKGGMERSREEVYRDWLSSQLDRIGGASLDLEQTKLVSFQLTRAVRKLHGRHSEGPDAVMRGNLTVTDSNAFTALLARGVGRHRAYGYGMLLLRPASV